MSRDEILNLPAGSEIDALIEEKIFDRTLCGNNLGSYIKKPNGYEDLRLIKKYSTDISAAWKVVEEVAGPESLLSATIVGQYAGGQWRCLFSNAFDAFDVTADTAPLAICRAALLTVMK